MVVYGWLKEKCEKSKKKFIPETFTTFLIAEMTNRIFFLSLKIICFSCGGYGIMCKSSTSWSFAIVSCPIIFISV